MNITGIISAVKDVLSVDTAKKLLLIGSGFAKKNAPQILTAISVVSLGGAIVSTVKATSQAKDAIEEAEYEKYKAHVERFGDDSELNAEDCALMLEEKIRLCWKYYIPVVLSTATSAGCAIASTSIYADRYATIAAMLALAETDNEKLKAKIEEMLGKETADKIKESIFEDKINEGRDTKYERSSMEDAAVYIQRGQKVHFVDDCGNEWDSTIPYVERAIDELNSIFRKESFPSASVNEFVVMAGGNPAIDKFTFAGDNEGWPSDIVDDCLPDDELIVIKLRPYIDSLTHEVMVHVNYCTEPWQHFYEY